MIALSSHKPLDESAEVAENQIKALRTWREAFRMTVLFGTYHESLSGLAGVVPSERPTIKRLCQYAAQQAEWTAIINADIICDPRTAKLENELNVWNASCGFSRRIPVGGTVPTDWGLDFFCAKPHVWQLAAKLIPEQFVIGKILWDTWMVSFMVNHFPRTCFDISPSKLFFHPEHGDRGDQSIQCDNPYLHRVRMTNNRIRI